MAVNQNTKITNDLRELLYTRFSSIIIKFYRNGNSSDNACVCEGLDYVSADFTTHDKKKCQLAVTLKYFKENTQEVYDTLKNPFPVKKQEFVCEFL